MLTYEEFRADLERQKQEDARRIQEERAAAEQAWLAEQRGQTQMVAPNQQQQLMEADVARINRERGMQPLSSLVSPQQISIQRPSETIPMREAFNPARYGFEGEQLRMPEGENPDRRINPQEYFKKGGEYWGAVPQSVILSQQPKSATPTQSQPNYQQEMIDSLMGGVIGPGGRLDEEATARNRMLGTKMMQELAKTKSGAAKEASEAMKREAEINELNSRAEKNRRGEGGKDPEKVALYKMYQSMPDGADKDAFGRMIGAEGKDAKGKALPSPAVTKLAGMADAVESTERAVQGFKPEYGGKLVLGRLSNTIGKLAGDDTGQVQWWQDFDTAQNQARHALFGSALTATEKAAWEEISINPRMDSREIQKNLARRQQLEANAASKLARAYAAGGYNKDQIRELLGASADYLETPAAPAGGTKAKGGNHGPIVRTVRLKNGKTGIEYADGTRVTQ